MEDLRFVPPTAEMKDKVNEFLADFIYRNEYSMHGGSGLSQTTSYEAWLEKLRSIQAGTEAGFVPATTYLALDGESVVGIVNIRHRLSEILMLKGGHIGYSVRPSERSKGYATRMLAFALEKCRELEIGRVLVTCDKDNPASVRTIVNNGGVLENEIVDDDGNVIQRYWIDV